MILVQEAFGEVTIPYGISLSNVLFDIFNETAIIFVPFIVALVVSITKARSQGLDEGSPAVLAIKLFEKSFYSMLFVLIFFALPWDSGKNEVVFKTHQCGGDSTLRPVYSNPDALNLAKQNIRIGHANLSLGMGLSNNITIGISETISGKTTCIPEMGAFEAKVNESYIKIEDENLISNLKQFNEQCYSSALSRLSSGTSKGGSALSFPYEKENNYFFGFNMVKAYQGTANLPRQMPLSYQIKGSEYSAPIKNEYKPENYDESFGWMPGKTNKLSIDCDEAAQDYKSELQFYIQNNLSDKVEKSLNSRKLFPQQTQAGAPKFIQQQDIVDAFVQQAFLDAVIGKRAIIEARPDVASKGSSGFMSIFTLEHWKVATDSMLKNPLSTSTWNDIATGVGFALETRARASDRVNMYAVIPLVSSIILTIFYIASPIVLILSGYSWKMVYNQIFILFYLSMVPVILNISYIVSNLIYILSESFYGTFGMFSSAELSLDYLMYAIPIFFLIGWTAICVMAGLNIGPFLVSFFTGAAIAASKAGNQFFDSVTSGAKGSIGKAVKGSKRQM